MYTNHIIRVDETTEAALKAPGTSIFGMFGNSLAAPAVNKKRQSAISSPINRNSPRTKDGVFGMPLEKLMGHDAELGLPRVITECIEFIKQNGNINFFL